MMISRRELQLKLAKALIRSSFELTTIRDAVQGSDQLSQNSAWAMTTAVNDANYEESQMLQRIEGNVDRAQETKLNRV